MRPCIFFAASITVCDLTAPLGVVFKALVCDLFGPFGIVENVTDKPKGLFLPGLICSRVRAFTREMVP